MSEIHESEVPKISSSKKIHVLTTALAGMIFLVQCHYRSQTQQVTHSLTEDSLLRDTYTLIEKGYVTEAEFHDAKNIIDTYRKLHAQPHEKIDLAYGDLLRTHLDFRQALGAYDLLRTHSKNYEVMYSAEASINGMIPDAFVKSYQETSEESKAPHTEKYCEEHPKDESASCTKKSFIKYCASQKKRIANCTLF